MARRLGGRCARSSVLEQQVTPTGFGLAFGSVVVVGAALVAGAIPASAGAVRLGVVAASLAGFAALPITAAAAAGTGLLAFLVFDGFLVNSLGQLSWHGAADGWRLLTLAVAVAAGFIAGVAYRAARRWLRWRRWMLWISEEARQAVDRDDEQPAKPKGVVVHTRGLTHG